MQYPRLGLQSVQLVELEMEAEWGRLGLHDWISPQLVKIQAGPYEASQGIGQQEPQLREGWL